jgi:hypothetical protein
VVDGNCRWHYLVKLKMSFQIRDLEAILFAGLIFGILPLANAQSSSGQSSSAQPSGGNHIIYSTPQGKVTASPSVEQPIQPQEIESAPEGQINIFADPVPAQRFPMGPPAQLLNAQNQNDSTDPRDIRKELGVPTAQQLMQVPTAEQMFGLPEHNNPDALATGETNDLSSGTTDESAWSKVWAGNIGDNNTNGTERASGLFRGFFDSAQNGNDGVFGNHWSSTEAAFSPPQASAEQEQSWGTTLGDGTPATPVAQPWQSSFSSPDSASSAGFSSQSPFSTPQLTKVGALPLLPALPSLPGRKQVDTQPPSAPSWTPKPPPWTQSQTPFGTPVQLNPQR